jgi:hypothetical protein
MIVPVFGVDLLNFDTRKKTNFITLDQNKQNLRLPWCEVQGPVGFTPSISDDSAVTRLPFNRLVFASVLILSAEIAPAAINLSALPNYENQPVPAYITRDNTTPGNEITDEGATLGRVLFYDRRLSVDDTISCASCHQQAHAFSDPAIASMSLIKIV